MFKQLALAAVFLLTVGCAQVPTKPNFEALLSTSVEVLPGCSGVAISKTEILTAGHCTEFGQLKEFQINVDGKIVTAYLKRVSKDKDLAVLFVPKETFKVWINLAKEQGKLGDDIWVIGNPRAKYPDTITKGIWSFFKRVSSDGAVLNQMDISGAPGNSGSMVINSSGELVGILVRGIAGSMEFAGQYCWAVMLKDIKEFVK